MGKTSSTINKDTFNVKATSGSTSAWTLTGGSIISGNGTNQVIVQWNNPPLTAILSVKETNAATCVGNKVDKIINIVKPTGLESNANFALNSYPNPAHDRVQFDIPNQVNGSMTLVLTDMIGRQVTRKVFKTQEDASFSVSDLPSGMYLVSLETTAGTYRVKLEVLKQ